MVDRLEMSKSNARVNFIYNALFQLSNIMVPLFTMPYLSRTLGAEGLGEYSFAYSVAYYFTIFVKLGLNNYGNRTIAYVKDDKDELSRTFWEIYVTQFFMGLFLTFIYLGYCCLVSPNKGLSLIMTILVISAQLDVTWCLYGLERFKVTSIRDILTKLVTMLLIFVFVKTEADVWKYALILCTGMLVNQLVILPVIRKDIHFCKVTFAGVKRHFFPNLLLFIPIIAISIYRTMDKIMIGVMSTDSELGYYHGAENVIKVPMALVVALGTVMLPRMSNMLSNDDGNEKYIDVFGKSMRFAMLISSLICMGIMSVAKEFVPLFYGEGFNKCVYLFYIILPGSIFEAFASVIRTQYLIPKKKDGVYIASLLIGATINVVLNLLLIPRHGSIGAAIGTVAAYCSVSITQAIAVFREANIARNVVDSIPFVTSSLIMFLLFYRYTVPISNDFFALIVKIAICGITFMVLSCSFLFVGRLRGGAG